MTEQDTNITNTDDTVVVSTIPKDVNPFIKNIKFKDKLGLVKVANVPNLDLVDTKEHRSIGVRVVYAAEVISDKTRFIKTYDGFYSIVAELTKPAIKLLMYILSDKVEYNRDKIDLTVSDCAAIGLSRSVAYKAIGELIDNQLIAKRLEHNNSYYINPTMFYKGERRFLML